MKPRAANPARPPMMLHAIPMLVTGATPCSSRAAPRAAANRFGLFLVFERAGDQRDVLPAEAKTVAQGVLDPLLARRVRDVVQVAFWVGHLVIDRRRQHALADGHDRDNQ